MNAKQTPCPACDKAVPAGDNPYRPFCSEKCRLIDLGAWLTERYSIPGQQAPADTLGDGLDDGGERYQKH